MNNSRPKLKKTEKKIEYDNRPVRYRCDYSSTPLKVLQARGWTRISDAKDPGWDLWWCDTSELKLALDGRLRPQQKVAHFRNHCELTRKNYLYRNLRRYRRMLVKAGKVREAELCDAMPTTYELPNEYRMFVEEHRKRPGCTWIVKPAGGSQGRGIFLFQRLKDIANLRLNPYPGHHDLYDDEVAPSPLETHLVQKYIDDPYLLEGRKFDLRIYVLVTSFQPLKVWLAREGFARLSGKKFSLHRIKDSQVHLTNVSIQLKASKADREDDEDTHELNLGGKWPLHNLRQYLTARHGAQVVDELLQNIAG